MGPGTRAGVPSRLGQDGRGEHKRNGAESDGEMVLGPHLASRRGGNVGEAGPLKGALSMLRGGLHVWSPRTQHPRDMGVAWMRGGLSGASTWLQATFRWSRHTKTDTRPTQRHGLHSTPRVSTHLPSADTAGLPQPAPAPPPGGPRRPGPRPPASGPCPPGRSQTGWAPRALHQVALQGLLL